MPPTSKLSHADYLRARRQQLLSVLKQHCPDETTELQEILASEENLRIQAQTRAVSFGNYRSAIDAITVLLDRTGIAMHPSTIEAELIEGGFAPQDTRRKFSIRDAIQYHTKRSGSLAKNPDGTVGLTAWNGTSKPLKQT